MFQKLFSLLFGQTSSAEKDDKKKNSHVDLANSHNPATNDDKESKKRDESTECDADSEEESNDADVEYGNAASEIINVIPEEETTIPFMEPDELIKLVEQYSFQAPIPKKPSEDVLVRPLVYSDRKTIEEAIRLGEISPRSLFFRFTRAIKRFTTAQLDYFTHLSYTDHFALGLVLIHSNYKGIATARYIVDSDDPTMAEWAVIVLDHYQGLGLGTMLFYSLCHAAYLRGIKSLKAVVHPDNHSVLGWMRKAHAVHEEHGNTVYWVVHLPLPNGFLYDPSLEEKIHNSFSGNTMMDPSAKYHLLDEMKLYYNKMKSNKGRSDTEASEGIVCGSYDSMTNTRSFSSSNASINRRLEELSASSEASEIDDVEFVF